MDFLKPVQLSDAWKFYSCKKIFDSNCGRGGIPLISRSELSVDGISKTAEHCDIEVLDIDSHILYVDICYLSLYINFYFI